MEDNIANETCVSLESGHWNEAGTEGCLEQGTSGVKPGKDQEGSTWTRFEPHVFTPKDTTASRELTKYKNTFQCLKILNHPARHTASDFSVGQACYQASINSL